MRNRFLQPRSAVRVSVDWFRSYAGCLSRLPSYQRLSFARERPPRGPGTFTKKRLRKNFFEEYMRIFGVDVTPVSRSILKALFFFSWRKKKTSPPKKYCSSKPPIASKLRRV